MSVAPAGKELEMSGFVICRIVGGKIVEERSESTAILETTRQRLEQERIERERAEQELRVARTIQRTSLPKEVPQIEGWQISPFYQPAREEVGGDFYDFFYELETGGLASRCGGRCGQRVPAALKDRTCTPPPRAGMWSVRCWQPC